MQENDFIFCKHTQELEGMETLFLVYFLFFFLCFHHQRIQEDRGVRSQHVIQRTFQKMVVMEWG